MLFEISTGSLINLLIYLASLVLLFSVIAIFVKKSTK